MLPMFKPALRALTLSLPILLASGCAFDSSPPSVVAPPLIPPLPAQAQRPPRPALCPTTCSKGFEALQESLQPTPTN